MKLLCFLVFLCLSSQMSFAIENDLRQNEFWNIQNPFWEQVYSQVELRHYTDVKTDVWGDKQYQPQMQARYVFGSVLWKDRLHVSATFGVVRKPEKTVLIPRRTNLYYELSLVDWQGFWLDQYTSFWLPQRGKNQGTVGDVGLSGGYAVGKTLKWWVSGDVFGTLTSRPQKIPEDRLLAAGLVGEEHVQKNPDVQNRLSTGVSYGFWGSGKIGLEGIYDRQFVPRVNQGKQPHTYAIEEKTTSRLWVSYSLPNDVMLRARLYQYFQGRFEKKSDDVEMIGELSIVAKMI